MKLQIVFVAAAIGLAANPGFAQTVGTGDTTVSVEGKPAARAGDLTDQGNVVVEGSQDVFIGGKPVATVGESTDCGGAIVGGSSSVFVNGKPMATTGAQTLPCRQ